MTDDECLRRILNLMQSDDLADYRKPYSEFLQEAKAQLKANLKLDSFAFYTNKLIPTIQEITKEKLMAVESQNNQEIGITPPSECKDREELQRSAFYMAGGRLINDFGTSTFTVSGPQKISHNGAMIVFVGMEEFKLTGILVKGTEACYNFQGLSAGFRETKLEGLSASNVRALFGVSLDKALAKEYDAVTNLARYKKAFDKIKQQEDALKYKDTHDDDFGYGAW